MSACSSGHNCMCKRKGPIVGKTLNDKIAHVQGIINIVSTIVLEKSLVVDHQSTHGLLRFEMVPCSSI